MVRTMDKSHALSAPATVSLRACAFAVLILSFSATVLVFTGDLLNVLVVLTVDQSIAVTNASTQASQIVLPQLDASIGMSVSCFAGTCFDRGAFSGPLPILPSAASLGTVFGASASLPSLYDNVRGQFTLGYDVGNACGVSSAVVRTLSQLALATGIAALVFLVATAIVSAVLFALVARRDVLVGIMNADPKRNCMSVGKEEILVGVVIRDIHQHLRFEKPFVLSVIVSITLAVIFSLISMAVVIALTQSKMKCGYSMCSQFEDAMDAFVQELSAHYSWTRGEPRYSCSTGQTVPLFIVTFALSAAGLVVSCVLLFFGMRAGRRRHLLDRLHWLSRQLKSPRMSAELGSRQDTVVQIGKGTTMKEGVACVSPTYTHASAGDLYVPFDTDSWVPPPPSCGAEGDSEAMEPGESPPPENRTLGSGIQLLKRRRLHSPEVLKYSNGNLDYFERSASQEPSGEHLSTPHDVVSLQRAAQIKPVDGPERESRPSSRIQRQGQSPTPPAARSAARRDPLHPDSAHADRPSSRSSRTSRPSSRLKLPSTNNTPSQREL